MMPPMTRRYEVVLALILASLVFQLAAPDTEWSRLVTIVLQGLALTAALFAAEIHPALRRAASALVILAVIAAVIALAGADEEGPAPARLTTLLLVLLAPLAIARGISRDLRTEHGVTLPTMFGVLCIYLLLGMVFAAGYGVVDAIVDEPFFNREEADDTEDFLYFSFATLTTVGYGDLTAATDLGRSIAITEALIGQIYLVTVVALIVGNLAGGARRARRQADDRAIG
jgi:Ion channel